MYIGNKKKVLIGLGILILIVTIVGGYFLINSGYLGKSDSSAGTSSTLDVSGFTIKASRSKTQTNLVNFTVTGDLPKCTKYEITTSTQSTPTVSLKISDVTCNTANNKERDLSNSGSFVIKSGNQFAFEVNKVSKNFKNNQTTSITLDNIKLKSDFSKSGNNGTWKYSFSGNESKCYNFRDATVLTGKKFDGVFRAVFTENEKATNCSEKTLISEASKITGNISSDITLRLSIKYRTTGEIALPIDEEKKQRQVGSTPKIWYLTSAKATYDKSMPSDYLEAFTNPSKWKESIKYIDVYVFSTAGRGSKMFEPDFLKSKVIPLLNANNIEIGLNSGTATWYSCKTKAQQDLQVNYDLDHIKRVANAGGEVKYIRLESVLGKPVPDKFKSGCPEYTDNQRVNDAVSYIRRINAKYPKIKIGVVDATASHIAKKGGENEGYEEVFSKLVNDLKSVNIKLDHIIIDTGTEYSSGKRSPGLLEYDRLLKLEDYIQNTLDVNAGIIVTSYDGGGVSDKVYYDEIMNFFDKYNKIGGRPDFYMLESWHKYPWKLLPDNNPKDYTMMKGVLDFSKKVKGNL